MNEQGVATSLPVSLAGFWQLLRDQITLAENALDAALSADTGNWQVWLFMYLVVCLTVRMAPFPGTMRGSLGAILLLGLGAWIIGMIVTSADEVIQSGWPIMSLAVAALSFLLLASLTIRGGIGLVRLVATNK
jgi:hypothetical protein